MSPMLTERGPVPVGKSTLGEKVGAAVPVGVVLSRMEALPLLKFATAKSGLLSPLMSPMLRDWGEVPVAKSKLEEKVGVAPPVAVGLSRVGGMLLPAVVTVKSGLLSPLMSPMLTEMGPAPVVKVTWEEKVGLAAPVAVVLSRMEAVSLPTFTTAKSGLPSPLMSSMLMEKGLVPVVKVTWEEKVGVAAPVAVVVSGMEAVVLFVFGTAKSGFPWA